MPIRRLDTLSYIKVESKELSEDAFCIEFTYMEESKGLHRMNTHTDAHTNMHSIEGFLWTIKHTNSSLDNSKQRFAHHGLRQAYNVCLCVLYA